MVDGPDEEVVVVDGGGISSVSRPGTEFNLASKTDKTISKLLIFVEIFVSLMSQASEKVLRNLVVLTTKLLTNKRVVWMGIGLICMS